ncbi:helix-turn-helix transcriptional regulator [Streptomyces sp. NBC_01304]|uniref:helix-turn-helix transcriptional regulator n=1 Tax=Streptomyces sp. NBC_01304 TaxID=2903818 RepID=UPI003FA3CB1D
MTAHTHEITALCAEGKRVYSSALRAGRIARSEADCAPCLVDFALLRPDPDDGEWLRPVPPAVALAQHLHPLEREIQEHRRNSIALTDSFEPFMAIKAHDPAPTHAITVLEGIERINAALDQATAATQTEVLTLQPGGGRNEHRLHEALTRSQPIIKRGVSLRTLYQHTVRHSFGTLAYADQLGEGHVEIRTVEELIDRLLIFDGEVAFIPAGDRDDVALELRHPGMVKYLTRVFEVLWRRGIPLQDAIPDEPTPEGITGVQRSIAHLLVEGHVDEAIARRLGMNVRTCRAHIAKLAAALGSGSRAQLGYLIAQSGILDQEQ